MKRVLMLAYFFPPSKAAGTFRTLRFVRDLPALGWAPSVLTVRPETYLPIELDPALLLKVPVETTVLRTPAPAYHRAYKRALESMKPYRPARAPGREAAAGSSPGGAACAGAAPPAPKPAAEGAALRSPLDLAYMLCRTPDIDAGWYGPALLRGLAAILRQRPDVIYATGGPWTTFLVARDLAAWTGVPLVLDYRDPWTLNPAVVRSGTVFERLALRLERTVVRRARAIVANTDVLRETLLAAQGADLASKTVVIHNSFDAADYMSPEPPPEDRLTLSYVGAMYDAHSPEPLLRAVAELVGQRPDLRGRFRIRLVGAGAPRVAARVQALGIGDVVHVQDPVPHAAAVQLQRAAHGLVLLLTVPSDHSTFVPSKLYEYVAANRPILAVTRGGALERLLRTRELTPWIYTPEDTLGIAQGILNLYERYERGTLPRLAPATVQSFSGAAAARDLVAVLDAVAEGRPVPSLQHAPSPAAAPAEDPVAVEAR